MNIVISHFTNIEIIETEVCSKCELILFNSLWFQFLSSVKLWCSISQWVQNLQIIVFSSVKISSISMITMFVKCKITMFNSQLFQNLQSWELQCSILNHLIICKVWECEELKKCNIEEVKTWDIDQCEIDVQFYDFKNYKVQSYSVWFLMSPIFAKCESVKKWRSDKLKSESENALMTLQFQPFKLLKLLKLFGEL